MVGAAQRARWACPRWRRHDARTLRAKPALTARIPSCAPTELRIPSPCHLLTSRVSPEALRAALRLQRTTVQKALEALHLFRPGVDTTAARSHPSSRGATSSPVDRRLR